MTLPPLGIPLREEEEEEDIVDLLDQAEALELVEFDPSAVGPKDS